MLMHPIERADVYRVVFGGAEQKTLPREAPVIPVGEVARALTAVHGTGQIGAAAVG